MECKIILIDENGTELINVQKSSDPNVGPIVIKYKREEGQHIGHYYVDGQEFSESEDNNCLIDAVLHAKGVTNRTSYQVRIDLANEIRRKGSENSAYELIKSGYAGNFVSVGLAGGLRGYVDKDKSGQIYHYRGLAKSSKEVLVILHGNEPRHQDALKTRDLFMQKLKAAMRKEKIGNDTVMCEFLLVCETSGDIKKVIFGHSSGYKKDDLMNLAKEIVETEKTKSGGEYHFVEGRVPKNRSQLKNDGGKLNMFGQLVRPNVGANGGTCAAQSTGYNLILQDNEILIGGEFQPRQKKVKSSFKHNYSGGREYIFRHSAGSCRNCLIEQARSHGCDKPHKKTDRELIDWISDMLKDV